MRISNYTISTNIPGSSDFLLLHGVTGALDKVSSNIGSAFLVHRGQELEKAGLIIDEAAKARLQARGYITDLSSEEERGQLRALSRSLHKLELGRKVPSFSFVPTYLCNLRCPYCFQPHEIHEGEGVPGLVMSRRQVDAAFAIIDRYSSPGSVAREVGLIDPDEHVELGENGHASEVGLFGGEPLMPQTKTIIEYLAEQAAARGLSLWGITNGVELSGFAHLLGTGAGRIAELQVTVDGMPHHHNKRRRGPAFEQTFTRIIDNIDLAIRAGTQIRVRMNTAAPT